MPLASVTIARWMMPLVRVGAVVPNVILLVELLKVWVLLKFRMLPPPTVAMLAKVTVAAAAPALFSVMVLPPQVEVSAPKDKLEAAAPLAVKAKLPLFSVIVRAVPPMRVKAVPVSSTLSKALFWTVIFPVVAVN